MKFKKFNDEVLYTDEEITRVSAADIDFLKKEALRNPRQRIRLCSHRDVEDTLHEMLIIHTKDTYVRPHKHLGKSESFHVMEGQVDVVMFGEEGVIQEIIPMGDYASDLNFYYRLNRPLYHTLLIYSDFLVFHETTKGPFRREETLFAPWAPDEKEAEKVTSYMRQLTQYVSESKEKQSALKVFR
ncbi:MAG TPA: WbuC family cupin fold metalloprotein [Candidatus Omnitrophota bacterium]|nr:WbuC family cupin fold metalloprotein [Candidatus Omnitrophota bacterium]